MASEAEISWAAGLFEGEGCISIHDNSVQLQMGMTDLDVVTRFQAVVGGGGISTMLGTRAKPIHVWNIGKRVEVRRVLLDLLPWLGERRTARAYVALAFIESFHRSCNLDGCDTTYLAGRGDRLYCSDNCSQQARRVRDRKRKRRRVAV